MGKTLSQNTQTSFLSLVSVVMLHRSNRMFASLPAVNFGPVRRTSLRAGKRTGTYGNPIFTKCLHNQNGPGAAHVGEPHGLPVFSERVWYIARGACQPARPGQTRAVRLQYRPYRLTEYRLYRTQLAPKEMKKKMGGK